MGANNWVLKMLGVPVEKFSETGELQTRLKSFEKNEKNEVKPIMALIGRDRQDSAYNHFVNIGDVTIHQYGDRWIPLSDSLTGENLLVSFDDFVRVSRQDYVALT